MFRPVHRLLAKIRKAKAVREASVRRARAYARLADAENRGDTRSIGMARMLLQEATRDALQAGL
jgi:hypothetical protein